MSLRAGITGATITVVGTPAWLSLRKVSRRRIGVAARGSIFRARVASSVVTDRATVSNRRNSLVLSRDIHVAVQGLDDVAVIAGEDAVYVGRLADSQSVGSIVKTLAKSPQTTVLTEVHPTSYRPWGAVAAISD